MRLHILSDLHCEFSEFDPPTTDADVIVLAGDIHNGRDGHQWARTYFDRPVIYVLGNHEFYQHTLPGLTETLKKDSHGTSIHLLENDAVTIDGYTFLGCTLWTNFKLLDCPQISMEIAERVMSDYGAIRFGRDRRLLRPAQTAMLHAQSIQWLRNTLSNYDPQKTIIVTHHAPSANSEADSHFDSPLSPAFASNLDDLIETSAVPLWIHGHTHYNVDYKLGRTRVLSNQRGYPDEPSAGFNPALVVEV